METSEALRSALIFVCRTNLRASLLTLFLCASTLAQTTQVQVPADSVYTQTIDAIRDNQKAHVQFRSILVRIDDRAAKPNEFTVDMLFDPQTKLFWWSSSEKYQDYSGDTQLKQFAQFSIVFLTPDRLVVFFRHPGFGDAVGLRESTERYNNLDQAQRALLQHFFQNSPPLALKWQRDHLRSVDYMKRIPRDFFEQCSSAMLMLPTVEDIRRESNQWRLRIRGPNGNAADVFLDEAYNVVSTHLDPKPAVTVISQSDVSTAITADHNGRSVALQARDVSLLLAAGCHPSYPENVLFLFDPNTHLALATTRGSVADVSKRSTIALSDDKIVCFNCSGWVVDSTSRYESLEKAQGDFLEQIRRQGGGLPKQQVCEWRVPGAEPPKRFYCEAPEQDDCPRDSRLSLLQGGDWQFVFKGKNGTRATVEVNPTYEPLHTDVVFGRTSNQVSYVPPPAVLFDLLPAMTSKDLTRTPAFSIQSVLNKSSTVRVFENGIPRSASILRLVIVSKMESQPWDLLAIYDPPSKLFWCILQQHYPDLIKSVDTYLKELQDGTARIVIARQRIVGFSKIGTGTYIMMQESRQRYSSIAEGVSYVLAALSQNPNMRDGSRLLRGLPLPWSFYWDSTPSSGPASAEPRYIDIRRDGDRWSLQIEGLWGRRAEVFLDEDYRVTRANYIFTH